MVIRALRAVTYKTARVVLTGSPSGSHVYMIKTLEAEGAWRYNMAGGREKVYTFCRAKRNELLGVIRQ